MLTVIPKWKVTVSVTNGAPLVFYVSEAHLANVLRTVSTMEFVGDVTGVSIAKMVPMDPQASQYNLPQVSQLAYGAGGALT